jgi:membrane-bound metal-dependent hydrolase YbcI (DUF457 family)
VLGHSHALSGGVAGLAAGLFLHLPISQTAALAGFTAGMALLPDLDKCGSSPARSLGFLSEGVAWTIGKITGGHRHLTHSILGIAAFTVLAALACAFRHDDYGRAGLALLITLTVSAGLEALHVARHIRVPRFLGRGHAEDLAGIGVAAAVVGLGYGLALIPLAVGLGCATHIAGDLLTDSGCMLGYPWSKHRFHLLPEPLAFTTGTLPELRIVDPLLGLSLAGLVAVMLNPGLSLMAWAHLIQYA